MAYIPTITLLNAQKAIDATIRENEGKLALVEDGQVIELDEGAGTVTLTVSGGAITGAAFEAAEPEEPEEPEET